MPKVGVLIYTFNRTDDAYINMEIIRNEWQKRPFFKGITIVHAFNGENNWWPNKYLEDELLYLNNPGHFAGAEILIDEGIKTFQSKYPDVDYVVILASDTWVTKPDHLENIIDKMGQEEKYLASSVWGTKRQNTIWKAGIGMDFFIIDLKWATRSELFPIKFTEFRNKYEDIFSYDNQTVYIERLFAVRFQQSIARLVKIPSDNILKSIAESYVYRIKEREPVHVNGNENILFKRNYHRRKMYWPKIGLITHHDPVPKQKALRQWKIGYGAHAEAFLSAKNLSWYNRGLDKHVFRKNNQEIDYGD